MSSRAIQAVAFTIRPESALRALPLFYLEFPEEWFEPLKQLQEERSGRVDRYNTIPIRSLSAVLRAFVPYLLSAPNAVRPSAPGEEQEGDAPAASPREPRPWLLAQQPIPLEQLWKVIRAWLEQTYSTCESYADALPLLRQEDLEWKQLTVELGREASRNRTAKVPRLAYKVIPAYLADRLVEQQTRLPVGQLQRYLVRVPTDDGAELMTWPPDFVPKWEKEWGFSYTVRITLQTTVGDPEPRVHFHFGVRRWQSDTCYDGQTLYLRGKTTVYLRAIKTWYGTPASKTFTTAQLAAIRQGDRRVPVWTNLVPQIANRLSVAIPDAEQLTSQPKDWLDGKDGVEAGIVYASPRRHPVGTGLGPDMLEQFTAIVGEKLSNDLALRPPLKPYEIPQKVEAHPLVADFLEMPPEERLRRLAVSVNPQVTIEVRWQTEAVRDMLVDRVLAVLTRPRPPLIEPEELEEPFEEPSLEALLKEASEEDVEEDEVGEDEEENFLSDVEQALQGDHPQEPRRRRARRRAPEPPPPPAREEEIVALPGGVRLRILTRPLGRLGSPLPAQDQQRKLDLRAAINQRAGEVGEQVELAAEPTLTLIELPDYRDPEWRRAFRGRDPKRALRLGMARRGRVTQFVTSKTGDDLRERCKSAVLDGLRQLGYLPATIGFTTRKLPLPSPLLVAGIWVIRITRRRAAFGVHLPVVVLLNTAESQIYAWLPHDQHIRPYREALIEIAQLDPAQVKKRKQQEALGQLRQFLLGDLVKLGTGDVVVFVAAQNARPTWQGLYNNTVPLDGLRFDADEDSPIIPTEKLPSRFRLVRLRTNLRWEMPAWYVPGAKPSSTAQGLWIDEEGDPQETRLFYNIASKPKTASKGYRGKQQNPRESYRISSIVETMPLVISSSEDPAMWAIAADQWRRMSFVTNDMTLFPLPLELAQRMSEYAEVIGPWVFPEEWSEEEDEEEERDEVEIEIEE
jgi:pPIWI_RE module N-terminal domain/RNaseH domain of pPIWI_RE/MID domain of pPIWI_RE